MSVTYFESHLSKKQLILLILLLRANSNAASQQYIKLIFSVGSPFLTVLKSPFHYKTAKQHLSGSHLSFYVQIPSTLPLNLPNSAQVSYLKRSKKKIII